MLCYLLPLERLLNLIVVEILLVLMVSKLLVQKNVLNYYDTMKNMNIKLHKPKPVHRRYY